MILKKRVNRIKATCWNGCFEKMDDHPVHTTPNHHPTEVDVLPKTFLQINLVAKWLVWYSSIRPPNNSGNLCPLFCLHPSSMRCLHFVGNFFKTSCFVWGVPWFFWTVGQQGCDDPFALHSRSADHACNRHDVLCFASCIYLPLH